MKPPSLCRVSSNYGDVRIETVFLILKHSSLELLVVVGAGGGGGGKQKKTRKNMKILPLNSYSTRVPIEKMLELQMLSFEMKKYMVLRLAEMEQN